MAGARDAGKAGPGKQRLDRRAVVGADIAAVGPGQEQRGAVEAARRAGPADDLGHLGHEHRQVQLPLRGERAEIQRLQEKRPQGRVTDPGGQGGIRRGPGGDLRKVQRRHRLNMPGLVMAVGHGRDVGHDQTADQVTPGQRQLHRGLAAHRMAQQIDRRLQRGKDVRQVLGHVGIALAGRPRAVAVVAHVDGHHLAPVGQAARDHPPVPARPIEAMRDDQGRCDRDGAGVTDRGQHGPAIALTPPRGQSG